MNKEVEEKVSHMWSRARAWWGKGAGGNPYYCDVTLDDLVAIARHQRLQMRWGGVLF